MNTLYLEGKTPLTTEKIVGALVALGAKPSAIEWELSQLEIGGFHLHFDREQIDGLDGVCFSIHEGDTHSDDEDEDEHEHSHECGCEHHHDEHVEEPHEHKHGEHCCDHDHANHHHHEQAEQAHHHADDEDDELAELHELLVESALSPTVKERVLGVFNRLAANDDELYVDLGEVVDVIGIAAGIDALKIERVVVSESLKNSADVFAAAILEELKAETSACAISFAQEKIAAGIGYEHSADESDFTIAHLGEPSK